jgi:hypothetical protein
VKVMFWLALSATVPLRALATETTVSASPSPSRS